MLYYKNASLTLRGPQMSKRSHSCSHSDSGSVEVETLGYNSDEGHSRGRRQHRSRSTNKNMRGKSQQGHRGKSTNTGTTRSQQRRVPTAAQEHAADTTQQHDDHEVQVSDAPLNVDSWAAYRAELARHGSVTELQLDQDSAVHGQGCFCISDFDASEDGGFSALKVCVPCMCCSVVVERSTCT